MKKLDETELVDPRDKIKSVGDAHTKAQEEVEWNLEEIKRLQNENKTFKIIKKGILEQKDLQAIKMN